MGLQSLKLTNSQLKGKHPLYDKVLDCPGLRAVFPYETFADLRRRWPDEDVNWSDVIDWVIKAHVSSHTGVTNAFILISSMLTKGRFMRKVPLDPNANPEHSRQEKIINARFEKGEISDEECRNLHADNDKKHGVIR